MKRNLHRKFLVIIALTFGLFTAGKVQASHTMGADLTYQCLGGNTYQITLSFYRDCIGIAAPANPFVTINSGTCGQSLGVTCYPRPGTGQEVTPACSTSVTTCNGGSFTGIQEWVYDGIITLPMQCSDWIFSYSLCCRNAAITTITTPGSSTFYIYATLNNLIASCNSSPTFSNKPVPFICRGQQYCFNHGAYDTDGDSLVYQLITPKQTASTNVNYISPYNAANPLNSIPATSFNSATGDICLTPQALEVTVMAVNVLEYRNGVLIGSVERDLQLTVMNCMNTLPTLTGINGTNNFSITVCANQLNCFNIFSNDVDAGQQLTVTWDNGIAGGTFTTDTLGHPTGTFCWTPTSADIGNSFSFTVRVADDACPYVGSQIYSYIVNVVGIQVNAGPDQQVACSDLATLTANATGGSGTYTYLWNNGSTMQSITVGSGIWVVTASDGSCTATDTVVVTMPFIPTAAFTYSPTSCVNNPIHFIDQSTTPGGIIWSWHWDFGDGSISTIQNPIHQYPSPGTYDVSLIIENTLGCLDTLVQQIVITPPPVAEFAAANSCINTTVGFTDQTNPPVSSWNWDFGDGNSSTLQNPSNVYDSAGTYTVTLISGDASGCSDTVQHQITIYPLPLANAGSDQTICSGSSTTLSASGGGTYSWQPGGSTGSTVIVTPGGSASYVVTITDANGCQARDTVNVNVNPLPGVSAGADRFLCSGGTVNLSASGALSYNWLPGGYTTQTITVDPATSTTYTVIGTDGNGCTFSDMVDVNVGQLPIVNVGPDVDICAGSSATLSASGGVTYSWSPGGSTNSGISVTPSGSTNYTVVASDAVGCTASATVNVNVHTPPPVNLQSFFLCAGSVATLDAGPGGASYQWLPNGETTQVINIGSGGTYSVVVTDPYGCSATASCNVSAGSSITINLGNVSFCQGDSATLDAGYSGMTYNWTTGATTQTIVVNAAGTYGVTVTDTSGCSGAINVSAQVNQLPVVNFSATSVCIGGTTQFTDASSVAGGTISSWSWDFGDTSTSNQQNPTHSYGSAGSFTATLTTVSANGCSSTANQIINVNPLPIADFTAGNACENSAIAFNDLSSVSTGNITSYQWNFGDGNSSSVQNPSHAYSTAGNYTVSLQVTTAGGCSGTITHPVNIHPTPVAAFSTSPVCLGSPTSFMNNSTIGTGSISSYFWDFSDTYTSTQSSPTHSFTSAGTFNVNLIISSGNGCTDTVSQAVTVNALPVANAGNDQSVCIGSPASLSASGGTAYVWTPGGQTTSTINVSPATNSSYTVTVTDANGCTASDVASVQVNALPVVIASPDKSICSGANTTLTATSTANCVWMPGNFNGLSYSVSPTSTTSYIVTGTDANGCVNKDTARVIVNPLPTISAGPDQSICIGSTISYTATGGASYQWNPIGNTTANVLVTPNANSTYTVIGTDANGCVNSDTVSVTVNPIPVVNLMPAFICPGFSTTLDAGNPGSTFAWSTGEVTQSISVSDSGNYTVVVTSANGCSALGSTNVSVGGSLNAVPTNSAVCAGQSAVLNAGNPGCTYLWSTTETSQSISVTTAGTYFVTITDPNGCSGSIVHNLTVNPLPVAAFAATSNCLGSASVFTNQSSISSGSIASYNWTFGDTYSSASANTSHTYASDGAYTATLNLTSNAGCTASVSQTVQVYPLPVAAFSAPTVCRTTATTFTNASSISSGSITNWSWNFGDNGNSTLASPSHTYLITGAYSASLVVTSDHGCRDTVTNNVSINGLPVAVFSAPAVCAQTATQFVNSSYSSTGSISGYQWNFGDGFTSTTNNPSHNYVAEGTFTVELIATTALGCTDTVSGTVTIHPLPEADFAVTPACANSPGGILNSSSVVSGSIANSYWSFGDNSTSNQTAPSHSFSNDGSFVITLISTTDFGCRDTVQRQVDVYPLPVANFIGQSVCQGIEVEFLDQSTVSSGSIASWNWDFADQTASNLDEPVHIYSNSGTYPVQLTVTTNNGCTSVYSNNVNIFPNPVAAFSTNNVCFGNANQFVNQSSVSGGIAYTSAWDFSDGINSSLANPSHSFLNPGNFNVNLVVTTANGCTDQITQSLAVYIGPTVDWNANDVCIGLPTQFNDQTVSQDGSIAAWNWNFGDGASSTERNPIHQYTAAGNYSVSLTTTTTYGCYDDLLGDVEIYRNMAPAIQASNACQGAPVLFVNTSVNTTGGNVNYSWDLGNGISSTDSAFNYIFNTPGVYDVTLVATTDHGCSSTDLRRVTIYDNPDVDLTGTDVCQGASTGFHNLTTINNGSISSYAWNFGDAQASTQTNPAHNYSAPGQYNVYLTAVSNQGCVGMDSTIVRVNPNPSVTFAGGFQGCAPLSAIFHDNSVITNGNIAGWLWNFGDGAVSTDQHPVHLFDDGGQYDVSLTVVSDLGCQASFTQAGAIRVFGQPFADFTADPLVTDILTPTVHFTNLSQGFTSYQWQFGDGGFTSTSLNPVHTFQDTGTYSALLITVNSYGCRDTIQKTIEVRPHSTLFAPNCFTPNGDGKNDDFRPYFTQMKDIQVWIFDRWGLLLTSWEGLQGSWDGYYQGKKCQSDTYVYKIKGWGVDGKYSEWVGHVSIVY
ncbi:MAG: PKD domain-containing protein [Bacteroidetes bacterium]|nr:PKD domain-containing protein [Bacteroidota bacterium]